MTEWVLHVFEPLVSETALWHQVGSRPIRPLSSLVLPAEQITAIVADAQEFQASEAWYGESS